MLEKSTGTWVRGFRASRLREHLSPNTPTGASTQDRSSTDQSGRPLPEKRENQAKPKAPAIAPPRSSGAQTLLARANTALASEQPATAVLLLERAVRIEPREALLWIRLSQAHFDQGDSRAAFQHARKSHRAGRQRDQQAHRCMASVSECLRGTGQGRRSQTNT